ncbi:non-canonical purine NTP pyrophosphatase, RdgB/HAM1 family [Xylanimonas oleitrophica]|uniref:dITP/XTP pyrophosphatase n=1 Tax=Xylanimonas oleitrophica TaxID=2607479 RepID=A0A2W5WVG7_9MICO|nr:RdgB/HAM1 family non-canonical purine NTP pyrophosphatase [Xylanimonas oleitrophica]PZR55160.1 non-canonical purine NTP pyrophosphatase, RdgB/HAM1 family [Xylanimonas oleitrophica]
MTDAGAGTIEVPAGARLVLATHNRKKLVELVAILRSQPGLDALPEDAVVTAGGLGAPEPVEDGVTFEENALIKARALARATGLPAVADDSGLAVDVLGGSPGIFSARWSGRHGDDQANLDLLLAQLSAIQVPEHRRAGFVCAAALVTPDGVEEVRRGEMRGVLVGAPRGEHGFGYDPVLVPDEQAPGPDGAAGTRTAAELSPEEKNAISHRGKAFRALAPLVAAAL